jgi:hypothetical protein
VDIIETEKFNIFTYNNIFLLFLKGDDEIMMNNKELLMVPHFLTIQLPRMLILWVICLLRKRLKSSAYFLYTNMKKFATDNDRSSDVLVLLVVLSDLNFSSK